MATYKVIQDIEAEDKLVGPFSLRQFIYLAIVIVLGFIAYQIARVSLIIASPFLLPILFFGALAAPIGQDQSTEVWLLAKIRFFLKPRRRIWNQDGMKQLVNITVPKKLDKHYTDGLSQSEVKSRLSALASTLDSRGWAVKSAAANMQNYGGNNQNSSDRLIAAPQLPQYSIPTDLADSDDIMDTSANPTAQNLDSLIQQSTQSHRQQMMDSLKNPQKQPQDYWFMSGQAQATKSGYDAFGTDAVVSPNSAGVGSAPLTKTEETELLGKIHKPDTKTPYNMHMKTIQPLSTAKSDSKKQSASPTNPDIMRLANNDDLNISTIARQANKELNDGDEVVVSLH